MNIIYMLLAISVFVALLFFVLFIFSVKKGQFDDIYTPSVRMLFEDELVKEGTSPKYQTTKAGPADRQEKITNPETEPAHRQE